jgi:hypothetical protein
MPAAICSYCNFCCLIPQEQFVAIANYIWAAMALILGGNVTTIRRASSLVSNLAADSSAGIPSP